MILWISHIFWLCVCYYFWLLSYQRVELDSSYWDLITDNDFTPSAYDAALSMWIVGSLALWLWAKFSLDFLNRWEKFRHSPFQLFLLRYCGLWAYALLGLFVMPSLIFLPAIPGLFLIEKIQFHIGDPIMKLVFGGVGGVIRFLF